MSNNFDPTEETEIDWPRPANKCATCGEPAVGAYNTHDAVRAEGMDQYPEWAEAAMSDDYRVCKHTSLCFIHEND